MRALLRLNLGFNSDMIIAANIIANPMKSLRVRRSPENIIENITPKTASRLKISAADDGGVNF